MTQMWKNIMIVFFVLIFIGTVAVLKNQQVSSKTSILDIETNGLPLFLEVGSDTCVPCVAMEEVLDTLRNDYEGVLAVEFLHAKNTEEVKKLDVHAIPTQIFFDEKGNEFSRHTGYIPAEDIVSIFQEHGIDLHKKSFKE
ncbi:MAG: thioredoxin family protein [Caldisericia bacterium]|nr:thioredoxin family protein [Caldisericia bacterium]MDD4615001.1 thioredoxin family protein [Caldisericia bacterium]